MLVSLESRTEPYMHVRRSECVGKWREEERLLGAAGLGWVLVWVCAHDEWLESTPVLASALLDGMITVWCTQCMNTPLPHLCASAHGLPCCATCRKEVRATATPSDGPALRLPDAESVKVREECRRGNMKHCKSNNQTRLNSGDQHKETNANKS